jgi:hypothetical protein
VLDKNIIYFFRSVKFSVFGRKNTGYFAGITPLRVSEARSNVRQRNLGACRLFCGFHL